MRAWTDEEREEFEDADARWQQQKVYADIQAREDAEEFAERALESENAYRRNYLSGSRVGLHNLRARGDLKPKKWEEILARFHRSCAYCGQSDVPLCIEHVVPIHLGGKNDWNNVVPACKHCNSLKSYQNPEKWVCESPRRFAQFFTAVLDANYGLSQ